MKQEFDDAKRTYLARIESAYAEPVVESPWGLPYQDMHVSTKEYAVKLKTKPMVGEFVEIRNNNVWLLFPAFFIVAYVAKKLFNRGNNLIIIFEVMTVLFVVTFLVYSFPIIPGLKKMFRLDKNRLMIYKNKNEINWEFIVRTDIKIVSDIDSANHYLVIHYYDKDFQDFRSQEWDIRKLSVSPEKLSFYIEHFKGSFEHFPAQI
jgi:uncharacterized membrane protein